MNASIMQRLVAQPTAGNDLPLCAVIEPIRTINTLPIFRQRLVFTHEARAVDFSRLITPSF